MQKILVHNTSKRPYSMGSLDNKVIAHIIPGLNEFDADMWKLHEQNETVKNLIKEGHLVVIEPVVTQGKKKVKIKEFDGEFSLSGMVEAEAIKLVEKTLNVEMLQRWEDEETRSKVKRALAQKIKKMSENKTESND